MAQSLRAGAPLALRGMKVSLDGIARGEARPERVREWEAICAAGTDLREGLAAFAQRRTPRFERRRGRAGQGGPPTLNRSSCPWP